MTRLCFAIVLAAGCAYRGPDAERSEVTARPDRNVPADGKEYARIEVIVRDRDGQALANQDVGLSVVGEEATIDPARLVTGPDGRGESKLKAPRPGSRSVRVTVFDGRDKILLARQPAVEFVAAVFPSLEVTVAGTTLAGFVAELEGALINEGFLLSKESRATALCLSVTAEEPKVSELGGWYLARSRVTGRIEDGRSGDLLGTETVDAAGRRENSVDWSHRSLWQDAARKLAAQVAFVIKSRHGPGR